MNFARRTFVFVALIFLLLGAAFGVRQWRRWQTHNYLARPSLQAVWPWPDAVRSAPRAGVTRWQSAAPDGTTLELLSFDFTANPNLQLALYDQDEDDARPFDNRVSYWRRGVWPVTQSLDEKLQSDNRELAVLWNGSFFGLKNLKPRERDYCFHLAPQVLRGKVFYNTGNHRWTWGVKSENGKPRFKVLHLPGRATLKREFDFATGATQCLFEDGAPLHIEAFPASNQTSKKQPVASTPREAGHIPFLDHMKTSRVSVAWTRDSSRLYLLFVKEPDGETPSRAALQKRVPAYGGWMLADAQRFWMAAKDDLKIENAVALDGGDVAQLAIRAPNGAFEIAPPRLALPDLQEKATQRVRLSGDNNVHAPPQVLRGGSLMYFYVSDAKRKTP